MRTAALLLLLGASAAVLFVAVSSRERQAPRRPIRAERDEPTALGDRLDTPASTPPPSASPESSPLPPYGSPDRGPEIKGALVDEGGQPVPGASLRGAFLRCRGGYAEYAGRGVAENGSFRFVFRRLPPPDWTETLFRVTSPRFVPLDVKGTKEQWAALRARRTLPPFRVVLRHAAIVVGRVLGPDGEPSPAKVGVVRHPYERRLVTDPWVCPWEDGSFELDQVDPEQTWWLLATTYEYGMSRHIPLDGLLAAGATTRIDLRVEPTRRVRLVLELSGWREGLYIWTDNPNKWDLDEPLWSTRTRSGPHRFRLHDRHDADWLQRVEFTIPHHVEDYRLRVEVLPPRE